MQAEIITIGDEILIGQIVDTNSAFLSKELNKIGVHVFQITTVQDDRDHILEALSEAASRVDLVLVTGGLGPTKDDITKLTFCEYLGDEMVENPEVLTHIHHLFQTYFGKEPRPVNLHQAMVPSSATILQNDHGTAPGMWMEKDGVVYMSMPGVPYEMKRLFTEKVIPRIMERFNRPFIYHKTLLTYGLGESAIAERITDWEDRLPKGIKLAYLPSLGRVRLRLSGKGDQEDALKMQVDSLMDELWQLNKDIAVGFEEETSIDRRIGELLVQKGQTLSLAESCTGGLISGAITEIPGSSDIFDRGFVTYSNEAKMMMLGVPEELIQQHGAVSEDVALAMAQGALERSAANLAVSVTGIAGPGGSEHKPEGRVCFGLAATGKKPTAETIEFGAIGREKVRERTVEHALKLLVDALS